MKILVSGRNSQVGTEFFKLVAEDKNEYLFTTSLTMNLQDEYILTKTILDYNPDIIINFSAFTNVDDCEDQREKAYNINTKAPKIMASISSKIDALLIHISTDYVFGNNDVAPFHDNSIASPKNYYGKTKLDGDNQILSINNKSILIRTASVFSTHGKNFVKTITNKILDGLNVDVVSDQKISLTCAGDLANAVKTLIDNGNTVLTRNKPLIFNYTNVGYTSWYNVAKLIFDDLKIQNIELGSVNPIIFSNWKSKADRPIDSRLFLDYGFLESLNIKSFEWQGRVSSIVDTLYKTRN